jgi:DNA-binding MarR family transcriptional regulator
MISVHGTIWLMATTTSAGSVVLLTRLAKTVYRRSSEELLGMGLRPFVTLTNLRDGPVGQQALGELMCLDANNLVLLLNGLESAGWATRERDPHDRRRHIVTITARGRQALERAERAMDTVEDEVLAGLEAGERVELARLLAKALATQ